MIAVHSDVRFVCSSSARPLNDVIRIVNTSGNGLQISTHFKTPARFTVNSTSCCKHARKSCTVSITATASAAEWSIFGYVRDTCCIHWHSHTAFTGTHILHTLVPTRCIHWHSHAACTDMCGCYVQTNTFTSCTHLLPLQLLSCHDCAVALIFSAVLH